MIEDTILRNQSLDIKISDIAFEITHKLLLDPKYENPPTYLIEDAEDYNAVGNIVSEDKSETLFLRKELQSLTHDNFRDVYAFYTYGNLVSIMNDLVWYLETKIEKNNIILEQEVATNIAYNMLMNNKNKEYISEMTSIPVSKLYEIEENIVKNRLENIFKIYRYNQDMDIKIQELVHEGVCRIFFSKKNGNDISKYPINLLDCYDIDEVGDFISKENNQTLYLEKIFQTLKHSEINKLFYDYISCFTDALGSLIDYLEENIKNLNIEFTKKVARKIAMRMMANGDDWQYISDVINISINELEVYQWFIDRWNKQEITSKN